MLFRGRDWFTANSANSSPGRHSQLVENIAQVMFDGVLADLEVFCNFFIGITGHPLRPQFPTRAGLRPKFSLARLRRWMTEPASADIAPGWRRSPVPPSIHLTLRPGSPRASQLSRRNPSAPRPARLTAEPPRSGSSPPPAVSRITRTGVELPSELKSRKASRPDAWAWNDPAAECQALADAAIFTASARSEALPQYPSGSGSASSNRRKPSRKIGWSSRSRCEWAVTLKIHRKRLHPSEP